MLYLQIRIMFIVNNHNNKSIKIIIINIKAVDNFQANMEIQIMKLDKVQEMAGTLIQHLKDILIGIEVLTINLVMVQLVKKIKIKLNMKNLESARIQKK